MIDIYMRLNIWLNYSLDRSGSFVYIQADPVDYDVVYLGHDCGDKL